MTGRTSARGDPFLDWLDASEERHFSLLTFPEVRRAVQSLSRAYVQDRERRLETALSGAGKRAAFAYFYGALHFLVVRGIARQLRADEQPIERGIDRILDLGCGTGVGGAAWALEFNRPPRLLGIDRSRWAASEARWTYRTLTLPGTARSGSLERTPLPGRGAAILLSFAANELDDEARERMAPRLLEAAGRGAAVLVVEPISRRTAPWWQAWTELFRPAGAMTSESRFEADLPEKLRRLDRAAGLDHSELTARWLWVPGHESGQG